MRSDPPRYSATALPAYRYVPGRTPHPVRDPRGHSRNPRIELASFDPARWEACEAYLHAIDLLNHGYFWECHEALEAVWRVAGRRSEAGRLLQGLAQIAAALLKRELGVEGAARRLAERGVAKLRAASGLRLGLDPEHLASQVEEHVAGRAPPPVVRLAAGGG